MNERSVKKFCSHHYSPFCPESPSTHRLLVSALSSRRQLLLWFCSWQSRSSRTWNRFETFDNKKNPNVYLCIIAGNYDLSFQTYLKSIRTTSWVLIACLFVPLDSQQLGWFYHFLFIWWDVISALLSGVAVITSSCKQTSRLNYSCLWGPGYTPSRRSFS